MPAGATATVVNEDSRAHTVMSKACSTSPQVRPDPRPELVGAALVVVDPVQDDLVVLQVNLTPSRTLSTPPEPAVLIGGHSLLPSP